MQFLDGYKTIIGAAFLALTSLVTGLDTVLAPETLVVVTAITGGLGAFLTAVGIGGKIEKIGN